MTIQEVLKRQHFGLICHDRLDLKCSALIESTLTDVLPIGLRHWLEHRHTWFSLCISMYHHNSPSQRSNNYKEKNHQLGFGPYM